MDSYLWYLSLDNLEIVIHVFPVYLQRDHRIAKNEGTRPVLRVSHERDPRVRSSLSASAPQNYKKYAPPPCALGSLYIYVYDTRETPGHPPPTPPRRCTINNNFNSPPPPRGIPEPGLPFRHLRRKISKNTPLPVLSAVYIYTCTSPVKLQPTS